MRIHSYCIVTGGLIIVFLLWVLVCLFYISGIQSSSRLLVNLLDLLQATDHCLQNVIHRHVKLTCFASTYLSNLIHHYLPAHALWIYCYCQHHGIVSKSDMGDNDHICSETPYGTFSYKQCCVASPDIRVITTRPYLNKCWVSLPRPIILTLSMLDL